MQKLVKAMLKVMKECESIDKSMEVGSGANKYKGVPDKEVKRIIGKSMAKHGLVIVPTEINSNPQVSRWETTWNGNKKMKQSVFTEVQTKYTLIHESGESIDLAGYGHGVDSQDKSAGKATTYALKNTLLYTFLVPTGKIDDTDNTHSNDIDVPNKGSDMKNQSENDKGKHSGKKTPQQSKKKKITDARLSDALKSVEKGEYSYEALEARFEFTPAQKKVIQHSKESNDSKPADKKESKKAKKDEEK